MAKHFIDAKRGQHCVICGGVGSSLPTECPGFMMSFEERKAVSLGNLDYVGDNWHGHLKKNQRR